MSDYKNLGNGFTHHDDTDCCDCLCKHSIPATNTYMLVKSSRKKMLIRLKRKLSQTPRWRLLKRYRLKQTIRYWKESNNE